MLFKDSLSFSLFHILYIITLGVDETIQILTLNDFVVEHYSFKFLLLLTILDWE